jgi:membrane associated rhomboid family serine protease
MPFDLPPVTRALLIANVGIYLLQMVVGFPMVQYFALWPWGPHQTGQLPSGELINVGFQVWQLVTYAFLHGGLTHLFFNMLALFMFGGPIERLFGRREFLVYYFTCLVVAAICQLLVMHFFVPGFVPTLGASGAIFGLLLAFGMMYPHQQIMLLFPPIPMPAWVFVTGYGAIELYLGVTGSEAGVAHFAHLGGMLGGFLLIQFWRGRFPIKPKRRLMR